MHAWAFLRAISTASALTVCSIRLGSLLIQTCSGTDQMQLELRELLEDVDKAIEDFQALHNNCDLPALGDLPEVQATTRPGDCPDILSRPELHVLQYKAHASSCAAWMLLDRKSKSLLISEKTPSVLLLRNQSCHACCFAFYSRAAAGTAWPGLQGSAPNSSTLFHCCK